MEATYKPLHTVSPKCTQTLSNPKNAIFLVAVLGLASISFITIQAIPPSSSSTSTASSLPPQSPVAFMTSTMSKTLEDISVNGVTKSNVPFDGILNSEWCRPPVEPPLPYFNCKRDKLMRIGVYGGLTNALGFILKGGVWAFQEEWCMYIEEGKGADRGASRIARRAAPEPTVDPFLDRYFEPIGIPKSNILVKNKQHLFNEVIEPHYHDIAHQMYGQHSGGIKELNYPDRFFKWDIKSLGLYGKNVIWLKKYMLRRMIRLLPERRTVSCKRLDNLGLHEEYIAMSIRRGDKAIEFELVETVQPYIEKAELAIQNHFGGILPKIFVASDDCAVMDEFRQAKPDWNFVSECDNASESNGFVIEDMEKWTLEQTDAHYQKFFSELIAMASAKYFIGVPTTNVAIMVYFMRSYYAADDTWTFVGEDDKFFIY